jgi:YggT family protein
MLNSIVLMVVQTIASLLAALCLLRAYMQWHGVRMGMGNAVAPWVMGLTDWMVLPLRRILPKVGRFNVTAKGGVIETTYFDWRYATPCLLLISMT